MCAAVFCKSSFLAMFCILFWWRNKTMMYYVCTLFIAVNMYYLFYTSQIGFEFDQISSFYEYAYVANSEFSQNVMNHNISHVFIHIIPFLWWIFKIWFQNGKFIFGPNRAKFILQIPYKCCFYRIKSKFQSNKTPFCINIIWSIKTNVN